jgi:pSer/pThr/pTyr-binding forkhead associated (FHA) protein
VAWLKILEGATPGLTYRLDDETLTAGRAPTNDIPLVDSVASRRHMQVSRVGGRHVLADLASKNGTYVNGLAISERVLEDGDEIRVGSHVMKFELRDEPRYRDAKLPSGWLRVIQGTHTGTTFHLGERTCTAGRDPGNLIQLVDDDASRKHAQFKWCEDHYELVDLDSTNGTFVNGRSIKTHRLAHGDRVRIGAQLLLFEVLAATGYRDHVLDGKDVRRHLREEETNVIDDGDDSVSFPIEVVEQSHAIALETKLTPEVVLRRIEAQVHATSTVQEFWMLGLNELCTLVKPDRGLLATRRESKVVVRGLWLRNDSPTRALPPNIDLVAIRRALDERVSVREHGLLAQLEIEPTDPNTRASALVCTPIRTPGADFGALYVDRLGPESAPFDDGEFELMRIVARLLAEGVVARTHG